MPIFNGEDLNWWILKAEKYFDFYRLKEENKVEAPVISLEREDLLLYKWEDGRIPIQT